MQKVIVVNEGDRGFLCVAKDFQSAVDYLIKNCWLDETTKIYNNAKSEWVRLGKFYGEDWEEETRRLTRKGFEELFNEIFCLEDEEIYGT